MNEQRQIIKNSRVMVAMTSISRVFGLIRDQVIAYLLGATRLGDVWNIAYQIPNLFRRLIAEGVMSSAFVPVLAEVTENDREEAARQLMRAVFSLILTMSCLIVALMVIIIPWALPGLLKIMMTSVSNTDPEFYAEVVAPTRLMFPYLIFISLAAICQGILNVHNRFALSAATPIVLNLCMIGCGLGLSFWFENPIWGLCIGVLIGGFFQFGLQWVHLYRLGFRIYPILSVWTERAREVARLWLPAVFSGGVVQINALVSAMVAANLLAGASFAVTTSNRLMELILGVFAVAMSTSLLPVLSRQRSRGDKAALNQSVWSSVEVMSLVAIPAAAGLILAGPSLISVLFERGAFDERGVRLTYAALVFHAQALLPISWYRIVNQTFYAFKRIDLMVLNASVAAIINIACCFLLPPLLFFPHGGVALATLISAWVLYYLSRWQVERIFGLTWPSELNRELLKMIAATLCFVPVWLPVRGRILGPLGLAGAILASVLIFFAIARLLRVRSLGKILTDK